MESGKKIITVFGSAFTMKSEPYYGEIELLGKVLAQNEFIVCSGGYAGIMEAVSKGAKLAGGKTIGVTVAEWTDRVPNKYLTEVAAMPNLMERIVELITIADGYVVLKGGTGTLVELATTLELMNKNSIPEKPIVIYKAYWQNVIETLKQDSENLKELIERNVRFTDIPGEAVNFLK